MACCWQRRVRGERSPLPSFAFETIFSERSEDRHRCARYHRGRYIATDIYHLPATPLPYVRSSVHMYACIARRLASRSSFRYPFASRLFETTRTSRYVQPRVHPIWIAGLASGADDYHFLSPSSTIKTVRRPYPLWTTD